MYYDLQKVISYNAYLNFLIGERGVGKTYSLSKFVTSQFIKKNEEFCYIRRYKPELKKAVDNFFCAISQNNEFPNNKLSSSNNKFFCDKKCFGYAMTLATSQDLKSSNFPNVKNIIFDEFIIEPGQKKYYLKNEVFTFLNLLETIGRLRDLRVFLLANACTSINPYFSYFNLQLPYGNDIKLYKNNTILVQFMKNQAYREAKKNTKFGQLIQNTSFENYAVDNNFIFENKNFIEKKSGNSRFMFAFIFKDNYYSVWKDDKIGLIFISHDYDKNTPYIFATSLENHNPNTLFLSSAKKYNCWRILIDNFNLGNVRFESSIIKANCESLINQIILH